MKILIVSDTHGSHRNLDAALEQVGKIDMLIHLGDVEDEDYYIEVIAQCPVHMVAGNNDYFSFLPRDKEVRIGKYNVWLTHGHGHHVSMGTQRLQQEARKRKVDIVMYGHTHRPSINIENDLIILNPGSLTYPRQEGRKPSYIVMETDTSGEAKFALNYL